MSEVDDEILEEFVTESSDALDELEPMVVGLTPQGDHGDDLNAIFRHLHSIKGTASFVNLPALTHVAHAAENLLDALRHGALKINPHRVDLMCEAIDIIRTALAALQNGQGEGAYEKEADSLADRLDEETHRPSRRADEPRKKSIAPEASHETEVRVSGESNSESEDTDGAVDLHQVHKTTPPAQVPQISLQPDEPEVAPLTQSGSEGPASLSAAMLMPDLVEKFSTESEEQISSIELTLLAWEQSQATKEMLGEAFRAMHSFKGNCGIMGLADMELLTHNLETTFLEWSEGKSTPHQSQVTAILSVLDVLRRTLHLLPEGGGKIPHKEKLLDALNITASQTPPSFGATPPPEAAEPAPVNTASVEPPKKSSRKAAPEQEPEVGMPAERVSSSIRVDTRKLDELMNLVGELIIAETTVTHNPDLEGHEFENFQKAALNLNRITRQLQDVTMQARMVPIETTFRKMIRLVRDVSKKQGKKVNLITTGEETEVDKSVVETIADPLVHLIRNGIDHGLEDSTGREAAGKPDEGQLRLSAHHQGGEVWISIADDGRGIDPEKVLASAIKKGVADPEKTYSRDEILHMIFAPGFSTAAQVTDISGRGVGMDVVKRNIERVNGRIDVDTNLGDGTTFTLRIPLTLAIIEGMLVRVGASYYTIPLLSIKESVKASRENLTIMSDGQEMLKLRDRHYPITKLSDLSGDSEGTQDLNNGILVLVESEGQQACILVDEVVGQRQTVIKPLPDYLRNLRSLSGCSILHNGDISLILDIDALVRSSQKQAAA